MLTHAGTSIKIPAVKGENVNLANVDETLISRSITYPERRSRALLYLNEGQLYENGSE